MPTRAMVLAARRAFIRPCLVGLPWGGAKGLSLQSRSPADSSGEFSGPRMSLFDYDAPADLFPARSRSGHRPVGYRRFNTAAEAIRYAIEQMPREFLDGTVLESGDERLDSMRIRRLYKNDAY